MAGSLYNTVNHLFPGTTDDLSNTQILTLHFTTYKEMFVKQKNVDVNVNKNE